MIYLANILAFIALTLTLTFAIKVLAQGFNKARWHGILILFVPFYVYYFIITYYTGNKWLAATMITFPVPIFLFIYETTLI